MKRYTLHFRGDGSPAAEAAAIKAVAGVRVVDHEMAKLMLIEADEAAAEEIRARFPDWTMSPEMFYPPPKTP